jgi:glycosyltransferase involved in cell wall biosynthesis
MRLSIIIPAYKVAGFIEKCIRSLEDQDLPKSDYEIIVTNDGSPDNCREIVEKLKEEFSNIVLINQENQGVSVARNNALAIAKGNYILPIDPDDYVVPNTFSKVLTHADSKDFDLLYLGFQIFDGNHNSIWQTDYTRHIGLVYNGVEGYFQSRGNTVKDPDRSWAILYKKSMLDAYAINYPKDVPYLEDGLFLGKVFTVAEKVGFNADMFYQRTTRKGSATNSKLFYSDKAINGFLLAAQDIKTFGLKHDFNKKQQGLINHVTSNFVLSSLLPFANPKHIFNSAKTIHKIKKLGFSKLPMEGVVFPYSKYVKYFNISPYYFLMQYALELVSKKLKVA